MQNGEYSEISCGICFAADTEGKNVVHFAGCVFGVHFFCFLFARKGCIYGTSGNDDFVRVCVYVSKG